MAVHAGSLKGLTLPEARSRDAAIVASGASAVPLLHGFCWLLLLLLPVGCRQSQSYAQEEADITHSLSHARLHIHLAASAMHRFNKPASLTSAVLSTPGRKCQHTRAPAEIPLVTVSAADSRLFLAWASSCGLDELDKCLPEATGPAEESFPSCSIRDSWLSYHNSLQLQPAADSTNESINSRCSGGLRAQGPSASAGQQEVERSGAGHLWDDCPKPASSSFK